MESLIGEYIELLIEADHIRVSWHQNLEIFCSLTELLRIEYLDSRMSELYISMKLLGMQVNQESAHQIMRKSAVYKRAIS